MNFGPTLVLLLGLSMAQLPAPKESPAPKPLPLPQPTQVLAPSPSPLSPPAIAPIAAPSTNCLISAEFLYWWSKTPSGPPLITTSNATDAGVIGAPSTQVLAGGNGVELDGLQGFRVHERYAHGETLGADLGGFYLANGGRYNTYTRQVLAIPYINPATNAQTSLILANINGPSGYAAIQQSSQLWNVEAHGQLRVADDPELPFELLLGGRFMALTEDYRLWTYTKLSAAGTYLGQPQQSGTAFSGLDQFEARNHFAGGQAGVRFRKPCERCIVEATCTLAAGMTRQELNINGNTNLNVPPQQAYLGDVFTQTSNIGRYTRNVFSVVPQGRVTVGVEVFDLMRVNVGADVLYWSGVVRPASQFSPLIYPTMIPVVSNGPPSGGQPLGRYTASDYWAFGLSAGIELAF